MYKHLGSRMRLGCCGLQVFIVSIVCLIGPIALANPISTTKSSSESTLVDKTEKDQHSEISDLCSNIGPITEVVEEENSENLSSVGSSCTTYSNEVFREMFHESDSSPVLIGQEIEGKKEDSPEKLEVETPEAQVIERPEESDRWHFSFHPYGTIPVSTYGSSTVKGYTVDYEVSTSELLEVLRFTASGRFEAWKGNLGFIIDAYYVSLQGTGIQESRRLRDANLESALKFDQGIYDFAISYNFGDSPMYSLPDKPSNKTFPRIWFQPIVGIRLNSLSSSIDEITLNARDLSKNFEQSFSAGRTWLEPMVGGKLGVQISDPVVLWARGDVSGFGLAGDTDLSWNIFFGVDWWVANNVSLQLAYRFYQIQYGNGSGSDAFSFEQNFNGPVLGATFHF